MQRGKGLFLTGLKKHAGLGLESLGVVECLLITFQNYEILPSHPEVSIRESRGVGAVYKFPLRFRN